VAAVAKRSRKRLQPATGFGIISWEEAVATERTVNSRHNNDAAQECRPDGEVGLVTIVVLNDEMMR
jgi:hypothetical protein